MSTFEITPRYVFLNFFFYNKLSENFDNITKVLTNINIPIVLMRHFTYETKETLRSENIRVNDKFDSVKSKVLMDFLYEDYEEFNGILIEVEKYDEIARAIDEIKKLDSSLCQYSIDDMYYVKKDIGYILYVNFHY